MGVGYLVIADVPEPVGGHDEVLVVGEDFELVEVGLDGDAALLELEVSEGPGDCELPHDAVPDDHAALVSRIRRGSGVLDSDLLLLVAALVVDGHALGLAVDAHHGPGVAEVGDVAEAFGTFLLDEGETARAPDLHGADHPELVVGLLEDVAEVRQGVLVVPLREVVLEDLRN